MTEKRAYHKRRAALKDDLDILCNEAYKEGYRAGHDAAKPSMVSGKKLVIPFADPDFEFILSCALQQGIQDGRLAERVIAFVQPMLPYLTYKTLWAMKQDVRGSLGSQTTKELTALWRDFLIHVNTYLNRKEP